MERSEKSQIVEIVSEEIDDTHQIDQLKAESEELSQEDVQEQLGPDFKVTQKIGSGSYGDVYEAIYIERNRKVAVKTINNIFNDLVDCKRILREIRLLRTANSEYIVNLLHVVRPKSLRKFSSLCLVLECADSDL